MKYNAIFFTFCFLLINCNFIFAQDHKIQFDRNAIGILIDDSNQILGTGFICKYGNLITTCAHLFEHTGNRDQFIYRSKSGDYKAKIVYKSYERDIAILKLDTMLVNSPIPLPELFKFNNNESLALAGYDRSASQINNTFTVSVSAVNLSGYHEEKHCYDVRKLLEFYGIAQPGYSGGPLLKWDGEVYAMLQGGIPNVKNTLEEGKTMNFALILDDLYILFDFLDFQRIIER